MINENKSLLSIKTYITWKLKLPVQKYFKNKSKDHNNERFTSTSESIFCQTESMRTDFITLFLEQSIELVSFLLTDQVITQKKIKHI